MFGFRHAPRVLIFAIDMLICTFSVIVSYSLRYDVAALGDLWQRAVMGTLIVVLSVRALSFLVFRTYAGIVRYTSTKDAERILITTTVGSGVIFIVALLLAWEGIYVIPRSIVLIDYVTTSFAMIGSRVLVKSLFGYAVTSAQQETAIILGSEKSALQVKRALDKDLASGLRIAGIFSPSRLHRGSILEGVPLYPLHRIDSIILQDKVKKLIIADDEISDSLRERVVNICLKRRVAVISAPNVSSWLRGDVAFRSLKPLDINDLLTRPPIVLSTDKIEHYLTGKVVLVTGAAGSIGSEIVRQITHFHPRLILLFDQAETPLYELDLELREKMGFVDFRVLIGSGVDVVRVRGIFEEYRPSVVFHAAAYKHVPMMEDNPYEAVANNIVCTKLFADLSVEYSVRRFVMVSTDKAVNPTNVMGASKRICEMYVQTLVAKSDTTHFITTRFGNVLGSNGSVVQRFRKQIAAGGPVTITHPEIRRFFMTIPEACQLVLEAGTMGEGGEIFVFDMGKPERIEDLAKKMIMLSGYVPNEEIKIVYVGLRPGEKLYEELLADGENTMPTYHPKIMRAKICDADSEKVRQEIETLLGMLEKSDDYEIVAQMKRIVPEFESRNSRFESLDYGR